MPNRGRNGQRYYTPHDRGADGRRIAAYGQQQAPSAAPVDSAQDKQNEGNSDLWNFIGDIAPAAGSVIGGGIGLAASGGNPLAMGAGAALGGGIGQLGGQAAHSYGDSLTAGHDEVMAVDSLEAEMGGVRQPELAVAVEAGAAHAQDSRLDLPAQRQRVGIGAQAQVASRQLAGEAEADDRGRVLRAASTVLLLMAGDELG